MNAPFWPGIVVPLLMFGLVGVYPFLERRLTGDRADHQLLRRPRDNPTRTSLGAITFYLVLFVSGASDVAPDTNRTR